MRAVEPLIEALNDTCSKIPYWGGLRETDEASGYVYGCAQAMVQSLGRIGDRRALPLLVRVASRQARYYYGSQYAMRIGDVGDAAREAVKRIDPSMVPKSVQFHDRWD